MTLTDGQTVRLPNGVITVAHPGHHPGLLWILKHPWACWGVDASGAILTLTTDKRGHPSSRATGWTLGDLREAAPIRTPESVAVT